MQAGERSGLEKYCWSDGGIFPLEALIRERILQKSEVLIDRIEFIERHLSDAVMSDRILRKALYKEFQEAVGAVTDICALIRRMLHSSAQDDWIIW